MNSFEVVILGGGAAGCATALSLVAEGIDPKRILVVEASQFERERIGESIPPDTRRVLHALGILGAFMAEGHEPCYGSASSWGSNELGYNDFLLNPYGNGWHLDRRRFDAWHSAEVEARGVVMQRGQRFLHVTEHGREGATLALGAPGDVSEHVRARFVVDATGHRALYAQQMGARRRELDLLVNVSCFFKLPETSSLAKLTFLEAAEHGYWYAARLPMGRVAAAFTTDHAIYKECHFDKPQVWLGALSRTLHIGGVLANCELMADSFSVCTAPSFMLNRAVGDHWLAVGDAASAYDPISSQGIFKALSNGLRGGQLIRRNLAGDESALSSYQADLEAHFQEYAHQRAYFYEQERRFHNAPFWSKRRARTLTPSSE